MARHALSALLACVACALGVSAPADARPLNVVASFSILADVVKQVGGEHVTVTALVGPNGDPHVFEPSPNDAKLLKEADLVFISGEGLEGWFARLATASGYEGTPVVASQGIRELTMDEGGETIIDPHVWNSPANVEVWVRNIENALSSAEPGAASEFKANAVRYTEVLKDLDAYARAEIEAVPKDRRKVLTSHDAFGYFARDYGVTFLSPEGLSTETEPSAAAVGRIIDQIKREHVTTYFFENSTDSRLVRQIARATGAKPGGELYVESLSGPEGPASTYARLFRHNVDLMAKAMAEH
jgi:zinc/manganese transport system substrate-binding protein